MHIFRALPFAAALLAAGAAWALPPGLVRKDGAITMQPIPDQTGVQPGNLHVLSVSDHEIFSRAFQAADRGNWTAARALAAQGHDPVARQLLQWRYLLDRNSGASFAEIDNFLRQEVGWPQREILFVRAEEAIVPQMGPAAVRAWFGTRNPVTAIGRIRLGEALAAGGDTARAAVLIRQGWIGGSFDAATELAIVQHDGQFITPEMDRARMDDLLWREDIISAKREMARLTDHDQAVAAARIALRLDPHKAHNALARVADSDDPGLLFDRAVAARHDNDNDTAHALLLRIPAAAMARDHAARWWPEVNVEARDTLATGDAHTAYALVERDALTDGIPFAESEFLAGFIALRFLKEPTVALVHFQKLEAGVGRPISKARAYYWEGRCREALGDAASAVADYRLAAQTPDTFYGQVALARIDPRPVLHLPEIPVPIAPPEEFENDALVPPMRVLADLGQTVSLRIFAATDSERDSTPRHLHQLMQNLTDWGFRNVALRLAKTASYAGIPLPIYDYPLIALPAYPGPGVAPEPAAVLGLIRQETEFDPAAVSSAGAMGIMQVMDFTAKKSARLAGLPYRPDALLSDVPYNIQLGMVAFAGRLSDWNGSLILAAAAYNGGPTNARRWITANGDPRSPATEPLDWIEEIPFSETRNYVMRVVENVQVYRDRLAGHDMPLRIMADLYAPNPPPAGVLVAPPAPVPVKPK